VTHALIAYDAATCVRDALIRIGRTEDVKLSPDNSRLAIPDYFGRRIFLFSIRIEPGAASPRVTLLDYSILSSSRSLREPHGIAFLDNDHVIVCNRAADVCVFRIPLSGEHPRERNVEPVARIVGNGIFSARVLTPGSVDCHEIADKHYRFLVCNNGWNAITSHTIQLGKGVRTRNEGILIENRLRIPDGVSFSRDHAWIAISNHVDGEVLIYRNTSELNKTTPPTAILRGIVCPHGVRFTSDGKVLVADAASQYLHVFESENGNWKGVQQPAGSTRLVDDQTFYSGRYDSREGGIKGIDIDNSGRLLITTHKLNVLGFYDLARLLASAGSVNSDEMAEFCRQRDWSLTRTKSTVMNRHWTLETRVKYWLSGLKNRYRRPKNTVAARLQTCRLYLRNRWSRESVLDSSGPVLSLTTHSHRLRLVFYAIESIAHGRRKPSRLHLWITDQKTYLSPPATLQRLKSRGLEVHLTEDLGPHTKYYPYVDRESEFDVPLVTADDDVIYPREWLQQLIAGYEANSSAIHCFRAHRIRMTNTRLAPYQNWTYPGDTKPSHLNFITGVSGVIYPPAYLKYLKRQGTAFKHCCPTSDDIWLTVVALRGGFKIAQLTDKSSHFATIPNSQKTRLYDRNVVLGENQVQLMRTLSEADLSALRLARGHDECREQS
jgi:hypothetical protein